MDYRWRQRKPKWANFSEVFCLKFSNKSSYDELRKWRATVSVCCAICWQNVRHFPVHGTKCRIWEWLRWKTPVESVFLWVRVVPFVMAAPRHSPSQRHLSLARHTIVTLIIPSIFISSIRRLTWNYHVPPECFWLLFYLAFLDTGSGCLVVGQHAAKALTLQVIVFAESEVDRELH